jgi:hypothetical protein
MAAFPAYPDYIEYPGQLVEKVLPVALLIPRFTAVTIR